MDDELMWILIAGGGGFVVGVILVWIILGVISSRRSRDLAVAEREVARLTSALDLQTPQFNTAQADLAAVRTTLSAVQTELAEIKIERARMGEALAQERNAFAEKQALLQKAQEDVRNEFAQLAGRAFGSEGDKLREQNKAQLEQMLDPLRARINEFQQTLGSAHKETARDRATLAQQIKTLSEQSTRMNTETLNLTRALKGQTQTQGAWGEMILTTILERAGLREGEEFIAQQSTTTEEGRRQRPDVVVTLPGGQKIIVDAKVSLTAFEDYVNAETDEARADALKRHVASLRQHIKTLAAKDYQRHAIDSLDYVIMFLPIEAALAAAVEGDANITSFAHEQGVAIATPNTLMIVLRTVANIWQVERRNRNADAIADRAGKLYDKFVGFVNDMETLGVSLDRARFAFEKARSKLTLGQGNLAGQVQKLKLLGARTSKAIPLEGWDDEGEGDGNTPMLPSLLPDQDDEDDSDLLADMDDGDDGIVPPPPPHAQPTPPQTIDEVAPSGPQPTYGSPPAPEADDILTPRGSPQG